MTFPFQEIAEALQADDLARFSSNFTKIILDFLPCREAHLLPIGGEGAVALANLHISLGGVSVSGGRIGEFFGAEAPGTALQVFMFEQFFFGDRAGAPHAEQDDQHPQGQNPNSPQL